MDFLLKINTAQRLMICLVILSVLACNVARVLPTTQIVEVTRMVEVPVEVTRVVEVPVEVTRVVEVVIEVPVDVTRIEVPEEVPPTVTVSVPVKTMANDALLVWYDFEGDFLTSGIVEDRSGNGYDAQVNGTINVTNGISGQAAFFFGNGYIQAQNNPAAERNTVSFSLWFKTDHPENNYKFAGAAWWSGGPASGWVLATHIPEFWSDDTQSLYLPGLSNNENHFPAGEWVHEVVTYDGSRIREYTNGQLVNDWPATGAEIGEGQAMAVGAWPPFSAYNFQGSIDEFQLFSRTLTPQEVQEIYNQR